MSDLDVLVVGSGIAGLSAAVAAAEGGATRILVAESEDVVGGSSRLSSGIILGAGSRRQQAAGYRDSGDAFYLDYMNLNHWDLRGDVGWTFAHESGPALDWLEDLGVEFYPEPVFGGAENMPRCLAAREHGQGVIDALTHAARARDVEIALGLRVDRLLEEGGRVVGAAVGEDDIHADTVVLATGGFGANPARLDQLFPSSRTAGDWRWYIGARGSRGDGLDLGTQVGAQVVGHDRGLRLLHPHFVRTLESYLPGWLLLVDPTGRRIVDESAAYGVLNRVVHLHGGLAYVVFDEAAVDPETATATDAYVHRIPGREAHRSPNWNRVMVQDMVREGRVARTDTVADLADRLGLAALEGTVRRYNDGAESGTDEQGKAARFLRPLSRPPFYAAPVRLATIASTWTGLEINGHAEVLDATGDPIPGLLAAGETTGGVLSWVYAADGNNLGNGLTFGRVAGRRVARLREAALLGTGGHPAP